MPCTLSENLEAENYQEAEALNVLDCIECGACAYVCPAHRPLVQHMRQGKARILQRRKQREAQARKANPA
jgi:electron transport complex protein RnfC